MMSARQTRGKQAVCPGQSHKGPARSDQTARLCSPRKAYNRSLQECEPDPTALKRAKALDRILRRMPVYIEDDSSWREIRRAAPKRAHISRIFRFLDRGRTRHPWNPVRRFFSDRRQGQGGAPSALPLLERENAPGSRIRPSTRRGAQSDRDRRGGVGGKRDRRRRPYNTQL